METRIKVAENEGNLCPQDMDTSLRSLEEALSIRRQIDTLEKRLASLLGTGLSRSAFRTGGKGCQPLREQNFPPQQKHDGQCENVPASANQRGRKAESPLLDGRGFRNS
ncbi:MAG: hypothetical protein DME62_13965 [Verrucomicrobia bacterium]|nr:MAG: hypothetical protein DME62_13965 [Verrucomicrobiota bacterium]